MPWIRIDERFDEHPKFIAAGPVAAFLWLRCLAYCNRNLTDGFIPEKVARERAWSCDHGAPGALIDTLIEVGLWDKTATGYKMHDYLFYQPSKDQVLLERNKKQLAGQAGGRASAKARAQAKSKPVPVPVVKTMAPTEPISPKAPFKIPSVEEVSIYCSGKGIVLDAQVFCDFYGSKGWKVGNQPMKDWQAAARGWAARDRRERAGKPRKVTAEALDAFAERLKTEGR